MEAFAHLDDTSIDVPDPRADARRRVLRDHSPQVKDDDPKQTAKPL